jgi:glyoxylase-like metal-dependent hydrolase (beta-lactamase superfamily II)
MSSTCAAITLKNGPTNSYLLKSSDGYLLIDTSFSTCFREFLEKLKKIQVSPSEIKYLLLTHHHDDHAGFAAKLKEEAKCRIIAHKNSVEALKKGLMTSMDHPVNRRVHITMSIYNKVKRRNFGFPAVNLDDGDIILDCDYDENLLRQLGIDGTIVYTPGHTNDSISVILDNGDAFVGDACMNFLNFCGIHYRPIWICDLCLVFQSWRKIIENGVRTIYPAHGNPFTVDKLIHYEKIYSQSVKMSSQ